MKSSTFARIVLLLPYLLLIESVVYFIVRDISEEDSLLQSFNILWNFLAIFWYIPYTILVIYLLIWSIGKTTNQIITRYKFAPLMLMFLSMAIFAILFLIGLLLGSESDASGILMIFGVAAVVTIPASLILGYLFVGISLLLYKLLIKTGFIKDEDLQQIDLEQNPDPTVKA
jgi:hypothetical protein